MGFLLRLTCVFVLMQQSWSQTGVCLQSTSSQQTYQVYRSVSSAYTEGCGLLWAWRCDRTRYRSVSSVRTRVVYHYQMVCCDGYTGDGDHCNPICVYCPEPGVCVAPDTCECPVGWTGSQCLDDIDECATGICNNCTNTRGSFQCTCPDGSILPAGQLSCISAPQMLSVNAITSTSLLVSWEAPHLADTDGDLESFSISCNNEVDPLVVPFNDGAQFSDTVSDLQSYTTYTCCVVGNTTVGVSASSCLTTTTLQDIPDGPPENIAVSAVSPFAIEVEWSTPTMPNGVIIHYTVYSNGTFIAEVEGTLMSYLYHGLVPYQQVSISVSASTEIGEGPRSTEVTNRTQESAPSMVVGVQVVVVSDGFHVSWDPPLFPNGVITGYKVKVINLLTNTRVDVFDMQSDNRNVSTSSDIEPYVPYVISVSASTRAGVGEAKEIFAFTKEGVPSTAPSILSVERTNTTTAEIQWELLSFKELRGNFSYEIVYYELEEDCPPSNVNTTNQSSVSVVKREPVLSIANLDPRREYCVGIAAKTGAGIGKFSFEAVSWYSSSIFTVVLAVTSCPQWIEEMPLENIEDIVEKISSGIEQYCQCHFSKDYIIDTIFLCDKDRPENVIFQGRIIGTNERDSEDLVEQLDKWKSNKPTVVIQGTQLRVVTTDDPVSNEHEEDNSAPGIAVGLSVVAIALLVLIIIATAGFIYWKTRQTRPKDDNLKSTSMNTATVKIPTTADLEDDTLKDLPNPFYGYGTHQEDHTINSGTYSEVQTELQPDLVKEVANPTYGITKDDVVLNPLYTTDTNRRETVGTSLSSSELYTEVPANKEVHAPDDK